MRTLIFALLFCIVAACAASQASADKPSWTPVPRGEIAALQPTDPYWRQIELIAIMGASYPVNVDIIRAECGQENSFYYGYDIYKDWGLKKPTIVLCKEMDKYPDTALLYAAHEMGHAITDLYTDTLSESDADELAALAMIGLGYNTELFVASVYFLRENFLGHVREDGHAPAGYRAWILRCLEEGSQDDGSEECKALYKSTDMKWYLRLAAPILEPPGINEWRTLDVEDLLKNPLSSPGISGPVKGR